MNKKKCNHNPLDKKTSLIRIPILKLVYPPEEYYFCRICQQSFRFINGLEVIDDEKEK